MKELDGWWEQLSSVSLLVVIIDRLSYELFRKRRSWTGDRCGSVGSVSAVTSCHVTGILRCAAITYTKFHLHLQCSSCKVAADALSSSD